MVSFVSTLPGLVFGANEVPPLKLSLLATIGVGNTVTVTVFVVSQFVGLSVSHRVYGMVYVPAGVPAGTLTLPVAAVNTGRGDVSAAPGTCAAVPTAEICVVVVVAGTPFKVSLLNTLPALALPVALMMPV